MLKGKFHLGGFYKPKGTQIQRRLLLILQQYFALPMLREVHMRAKVDKLEKELRAIPTSGLVSEETSRGLNRFHNYMVKFWMAKQGSSTISVSGALHKTNNVIER